jgi:hypothetical protein
MDLTNARWHKSSISSGNGGDCVEVASNLPDVVALRDSKDPGTALLFDQQEWLTFINAVKSGEFDV